MNWYIVQAYSGFEKKVVESIKDELKKHKLSDNLDEIIVPTHQVTEVKKGKRTKKEKKFFPGYVLLKINLTKLYLKDKNNDKKLLYGCIESDISYALCAKGYNTAFISALTAFHKISPTNRNNEYRTKESICRFFRMINNYSPYNKLFFELFRGIYLCLYNSIVQRKIIYFKCILISMLSNSNNIFNKNRISNRIYKKMRKLLIEPGFGGKL